MPAALFFGFPTVCLLASFQAENGEASAEDSILLSPR